MECLYINQMFKIRNNFLSWTWLLLIHPCTFLAVLQKWLKGNQTARMSFVFLPFQGLIFNKIKQRNTGTYRNVRRSLLDQTKDSSWKLTSNIGADCALPLSLSNSGYLWHADFDPGSSIQPSRIVTTDNPVFCEFAQALSELCTFLKISFKSVFSFHGNIQNLPIVSILYKLSYHFLLPLLKKLQSFLVGDLFQSIIFCSFSSKTILFLNLIQQPEFRLLRNVATLSSLEYLLSQ